VRLEDELVGDGEVEGGVQLAQEDAAPQAVLALVHVQPLHRNQQVGVHLVDRVAAPAERQRGTRSGSSSWSHQPPCFASCAALQDSISQLAAFGKKQSSI
jgi:hypothetical protein